MKSNEKRQKIIQSAKYLIHKYGYHQTSLANIAEHSGIRIGNIYYYFNSKKKIVQAIIDQRTEGFLARARQWEVDEPDPRNRLIYFLQIPPENEKTIARYGCSVGSLIQELSKANDIETEVVNKTIQAQINWVTEQFRLLGKADPDKLAHHFIATIQGACLLANSMKNSKLLHAQLDHLRKALDDGQCMN